MHFWGFCGDANLDDWWVNVNHVESYAKFFIAILLSRDGFSDCEHLNCFLIFGKKQCWDANCCRCGMDPSSCPLWLLLWTYWCLGLVQAGSVSSFKASRLVVDWCLYKGWKNRTSFVALGRSWPLASHLPGAPASGLTEKNISWYRIYHDQPHTGCIQELLDSRGVHSVLPLYFGYMCSKLVVQSPSPPDMSPIGWSSQVNLLMLHTDDHPMT